MNKTINKINFDKFLRKYNIFISKNYIYFLNIIFSKSIYIYILKYKL